MVGVEYRRIIWSFKNRPHIYIFDEKFLWILDSFLHYDFGIFLCFICVLCRAKILPQIYTRIIASLRPPPYTRIIRERNSAQIYMKNRGAFRICVSDWLSVGIFAFVCIAFCICGHRLDKVVFFVDWSMSKFCCKSVMKSHKLIVKMWLCICNCICIYVCIWYWLWLVVVLIR